MKRLAVGVAFGLAGVLAACGESTRTESTPAAFVPTDDALDTGVLADHKLAETEPVVISRSDSETLTARIGQDGTLCLELTFAGVSGSSSVCADPSETDAVTLLAVAPPDGSGGFGSPTMAGVSRATVRSFDVTSTDGNITSIEAVHNQRFPDLSFFVMRDVGPLARLAAIDREGAEVGWLTETQLGFSKANPNAEAIHQGD